MVGGQGGGWVEVRGLLLVETLQMIGTLCRSVFGVSSLKQPLFYQWPNLLQAHLVTLVLAGDPSYGKI